MFTEVRNINNQLYFEWSYVLISHKHNESITFFYLTRRYKIVCLRGYSTCTIMYIISVRRRGNREGAASELLRFGMGG